MSNATMAANHAAKLNQQVTPQTVDGPTANLKALQGRFRALFGFIPVSDRKAYSAAFKSLNGQVVTEAEYSAAVSVMEDILDAAEAKKDAVKYRIHETAVTVGHAVEAGAYKGVGVVNETYKMPFQVAKAGVAVASLTTLLVLDVAEMAPEKLAASGKSLLLRYRDAIREARETKSAEATA